MNVSSLAVNLDKKDVSGKLQDAERGRTRTIKCCKGNHEGIYEVGFVHSCKSLFFFYCSYLTLHQVQCSAETAAEVVESACSASEHGEI